MAEIVIVAHTPLATALKGFAEHCYGHAPDQLIAIDVPAHEDSKVTLDRVTAALNLTEKINPSKEALILTDIFGATPANVATKVARMEEYQNKVVVLTGVNLSMLLRALSHREEPLDELAEKALQGGQQGVLRLRESVKV